MGSATGALGVPVSSNLKVGQGARADIINGTVEGRTSISGVMNLGVNPQGYDPARVAALKGNVKVSDTGQLNIFYGADVKNADLDASGEITLSHQVANVDNRYDYHLGALKNSGIVKLGQSNGGYSTLNLASLSGAGQFWMNTDLSTLQGDQIRVEGETQGSHTLVVADSGYEPQAAGGRLTLVSGSGGAGTFVLMGDHVDAGAFRYVLSKEGQDWVLANSAVPINPIAPVVPVTPKPENLSKGANAATATQTARAALWNAETGTLVQRLGDLRLGHDEGGVWMRNMDSRYKFDTSTSRAFDQNIHGMQIGADKALSVESGKVYVGSFIGVGQARQSLGEGAKSQIDSKSVGAYATYLDDNGIYVDTVAKFSRYDTDMRSTSNLGDKVHGSFDSNAYGVSVEVGKRFNLDRGWFVEPQVQLSSGRLQGGRYTSTDGLQVKADAIDTLQSRVGGLLGNTIQLNDGMAVRPYIKASWITEHRGDSQVRVNNVKLSSDLPGDHGEVGLGAVLQLNSQHNLSVDAEYGNGNGIEQPWVVNIGYRFAL
ncbi:hypothetical protein AA957_28540 [Pseudomonas trivialis]|uniref:Autotransporter domain-containing protein n=2 Tax=Pseudomonas trivialis TaxID=200450 RepID=A0A0H5AI51_9PSED|nr:hypothetical protein AA957_28540 [Pseudomonas trivialis]